LKRASGSLNPIINRQSELLHSAKSGWKPFIVETAVLVTLQAWEGADERRGAWIEFGLFGVVSEPATEESVKGS
jgi:hypothetical protein